MSLTVWGDQTDGFGHSKPTPLVISNPTLWTPHTGGFISSGQEFIK
ncbi:MAG: hypothetical protein LBV57_06085 [Candidatus Symbiothrix sp.]|nr:hypothetical protein [Candidatus Symbiothrix sp.]